MKEREPEKKIPPGLGSGFERLAEVMATLRSPGGCPWDLEQTPRMLARHLLEEAYESVEAIEAGDWEHLEEELGDLLLQVVFQARIAEEEGRFDLSGVVEGITAKLERRHPHIFGSARAETAAEVITNWDRIKREQEGKDTFPSRAPALPPLMEATKIQGGAARDGFDWVNGDDVFEKLEEEKRELWEIRHGPKEEVEKEIGDILFTVVNLARHLGVDPGQALRGTCREFVRRYRLMDAEASKRGLDLASMSLEEKDRLWERAKDNSEEKKELGDERG